MTKRVTKRKSPRSEGTLRDLQLERTREHLLETAAAFFDRHPSSTLTLPKLARLAGVTPPTAYAHFGSVAQLMDALASWIAPRLGTRDPLPPLAALDALPRTRYPRFASHGGLLRAAWTSGTWSRQRTKTRSPTITASIAQLRAAVPSLREHEALLAMAPVLAFADPPTWQWLRDVAALDDADAARAASWAIRTLVHAIERGDTPTRPTRPTQPKRRAPKRRSTPKTR